MLQTLLWKATGNILYEICSTSWRHQPVPSCAAALLPRLSRGRWGKSLSVLCLWSLFQLFSRLCSDPLGLLLGCTCPSLQLTRTAYDLEMCTFDAIRNLIPTFEQWSRSCGWQQRKWYLKHFFPLCAINWKGFDEFWRFSLWSRICHARNSICYPAPGADRLGLFSNLSEKLPFAMHNRQCWDASLVKVLRIRDWRVNCKQGININLHRLR